MITVIPLAQISIDWDTLLKVGRQTLGHKITTTGKKVGDAGSYIEILGNIRELDNPGPLLKHLFYSFMVVTDFQFVNDDLQLSCHRIECDGGIHLLILSGTLDKWQTAVINGCSPVSDMRSRYVMDQCLDFFDTCGLKSLWSSYRRVKQPDKTIKLLENK